MRAPRPVVLDLDQTLIRAEVLDWTLWLEAIALVFGQPIPLDRDWGGYPIHTDHGLLESLSQELRGKPFGEDERARFEADLISRIDGALAADPAVFVPIDGAHDLLAALQGRSGLATGNLHPVTQRKLRSSGLDRWPMPCSCSAAGINRTELVRRALLRTGWEPGGAATSFGDGVWDVRAARALGVGFIGVAQSARHAERLRAAGAEIVLRDYRDLPAVLEFIEEAPLPGPEAPRAWRAPQVSE